MNRRRTPAICAAMGTFALALSLSCASADARLRIVPAAKITEPAAVVKDYRGPYPRDLAEAGVEGSVVMLVTLRKTGAIERVQIAESSGNARLDDLALSDIARFQFRPARMNGEPVDSILRYTYTFELLGQGLQKEIDAYDDEVSKAITLKDPWPAGVDESVGTIRCATVIDVARDGSFTREPRLYGKGTGHSEFDRECLRAMRDAKLPPVPASLHAPLHVKHVIVFHAPAHEVADAGVADAVP